MARKKSNRKWIIIGLIATIGVLAAAAYMKTQNQDDSIEIETSKSEMRTIRETVSASGRIYPEVEVIISSDVSGEIVELYVEEGDSVVAGQLLLKIDPEVYVSAVDRGVANLNTAKAQLAMSRAQIQTNIAQREELMTTLKQAGRDHKRNAVLFEQGVISQAEFDQTLSLVESAEASIRSSEANIKSAEESALGSEFSVASSEASLKEMRTNLNKTTIKAPNSGTISSLSVEQGERVVGTAQMAGTEIMRISNLNTMEVQVEVSENDIPRVSIGDIVNIEVDAYLDTKFKGNVTEIANSASNTTSGGNVSLTSDQVTNFIVKIRINPDSYSEISADNKIPFRPGMSASVSIFTQTVEDVLTIPIQAVTVRDPNEKDDEEDDSKDKDDLEEVVFLMAADTVSLVQVETGIQDDEYIQILSGVNEGESIVKGPYKTVSKVLKSGSRVRIKSKKKKKEDSEE